MNLTIKDIAKLAGVSSATVSRVLNNASSVKKETREQIERIIEENHYVPNVMAQGLSKNESSTVGVIVPDICNPFFCEVIKGIGTVADENGLKIILCDTDEDPQKEVEYLEDLKQLRPKGIIITPISDSNEFNSQYLSLLEGLGIPIALVDRDVKYSNFDGVFIDNIKGAFDATSALLGEGHREIALIAGPKTSKPGRDRLRGYLKAFDMSGLKADESLIYYGDFRLESGYGITKTILGRKDRPTAIFSCNNLMTMGTLKALREAGCRVPDDMALIGFDQNSMLDILDFKISYIARQTTEMGRIAMEILLEQFDESLRKDRAVKRITLIPELVLNGSEKRISR